ncbi:MAG: DUF4198 domain-containing protein, partial [Planctomycetes bacterium]|nr:DUF4198 domain-containing protein [Planctomycetota bacterium]
MKSPAFALAILLSTLAGPAWAADLWLEPARFRFEASGGRVGVRAQLGTPRSARPQLRRAARAQGLWVQGPQGWLEAPGKSGDDPIGMASLRGDGAHLLAYRGKRGFGRLGNEGWLRLFRETGRDVADAPTHVTSVLYQRSAKALVLAGPPRGAPWLKALGLELELIPLAAPHELADAPGGLASLPLRLVWRGQPQVGVELRAWPLDGAKLKEAITATTDKRGQASIRLTRRGAWVVCATALRKGDLTRHEVGFTSFSFSADPAPPAPGPAALARALRT